MSDRSPVNLRADKTITAFHEAGHAVACMHYGIPFSFVRIDPAWFADSCSGLLHFPPGVETKLKPRSDAVMSLAGGAMETLFRARNDLPEPDRSRWEVDLECARLACELARISYREAWAEAMKLATVRMHQASSVAFVLMDRRKLTESATKRASTTAVPLRT